MLRPQYLPDGLMQLSEYDYFRCRAPFIHQANYALVMFEQHSGAHAYTQLHLTASTLAATLNNGNYSALLGFAQGNLAEMSSFSRAQPPMAQPHECRTTFAESFCFEPPAGDRPSFYMTVSAPDLTVYFWSDTTSRALSVLILYSPFFCVCMCPVPLVNELAFWMLCFAIISSTRYSNFVLMAGGTGGGAKGVAVRLLHGRQSSKSRASLP